MDDQTKPSAITIYRKLRETWHYNPETGVFTRIAANVQGPSGSEHGFVNTQGYLAIPVGGRAYPAARMAWLYMKAQWPERNVRTVNGDRMDLRWSNLVLRPPKLVKKERRELTAHRLREALDYDLETGVFRWKVSTPRAKTGTEAGVITNTGYRIISLDGVHHLAHRLAMLHVHGGWPQHQVDHINGVRADNRFANLREATPGQNTQNVGRRSTNTSGYKGVSPHKGRWHARIVVNYQTIPLGYFSTPEEAHAAYCAAAKKYHGDFANNGGPQEPPAPEEADLGNH